MIGVAELVKRFVFTCILMLSEEFSIRHINQPVRIAKELKT